MLEQVILRPAERHEPARVWRAMDGQAGLPDCLTQSGEAGNLIMMSRSLGRSLHTLKKTLNPFSCRGSDLNRHGPCGPQDFKS